jgi:hypothetical protein
VVVPLLCTAFEGAIWSDDKPNTPAGNFGYSYEEIVDQDSVKWKYAIGVISPIHKGIFKVYLDYELTGNPTLKGFRYKDLDFTFGWDLDRIWVENVRELGKSSFGCFVPGPEITHNDAWEIRCKAIEEIERLKKKHCCEAGDHRCSNYCGVYRGEHLIWWKYSPPTKDELETVGHCDWQYCPFCGKKLK